MEIAGRFCEKELSDYEVVYSAHTDTEHMHAHIIFNSVNFRTGCKYRYNKNDWERKLQPLVDQLCKEQEKLFQNMQWNAKGQDVIKNFRTK